MTSSGTPGVIELPGRTQLELTGADRQTFLHNLCTNDIRRLTPGQACEAMLLDAKGHVLFYVHVFAGEESLVLESAAGEGARMQAHLERYHMREKVEIIDRTAEWGEIYLSGLREGDRFPIIDDARLDVVQRCFSCVIEGVPVSIRRVSFGQLPDFLLSMPMAELSRVKAALLNAGARDAPGDNFELTRILGRFPWPAEIGEKTLPQELDRDEKAISFVKGCYIGQETVARIDALGHVNRLLRLISFRSGEVTPGMPLLHEGQEVGRVTSAVRLPLSGSTCALAFVRRASAGFGTTFDSEAGPGTVRDPQLHAAN